MHTHTLHTYRKLYLPFVTWETEPYGRLWMPKKTRYDNLIVQVFNVVSDCELFLSACVNPLQSDFSQHKK